MSTLIHRLNASFWMLFTCGLNTWLLWRMHLYLLQSGLRMIWTNPVWKPAKQEGQ